MKRLVLILGALLATVLCPFVGMVPIGWEVLTSASPDPTQQQIFWQIRLPRVLLAFISGAALSVGGLVFQGVFRNFLACPFTLGVSTGAAFGAALYFRLGLSFVFFGMSGASWCAFIGALLTISFVFVVSGGLSTSSMLLAGVVVSFFFSSLIIFLQYISDFEGMFRIMRWLMGGFETVGWTPLWSVLPFAFAGILMVRLFERDLDLLTLGDELASSRGLRIRRIRALFFLATSLMVGGVVSICGPIGFIGIMVPHLTRLLFGAMHRGLTMVNALFGGAFLVICDTLGRTIVAPYEIPVGVITALLGGPFFLSLLLRRRRAGPSFVR